MREIRSPRTFQREMEKARRKGKTIGFVPTMGTLHEGHCSLIRAACRENDICVVSIFVNPLQFGPKEDFRKYPRTIARDKTVLRKHRVDYLFHPVAGKMYPKGYATIVDTGGKTSFGGSAFEGAPLANVLCGKSRPGHFQGVLTVVSKLFHLARPHRVYFGAKDYQQAVIVRRLIRDLDFDIEFRLLPTVREKDGLAMSSRNRYLSPEERKNAKVISETLFWIRDRLRSGRRDLAGLRREGRRKLKTKVDKIDYFEIVDPESLQGLKRVQPALLAAAACYVGKTRLIDNVIIRR